MVSYDQFDVPNAWRLFADVAFGSFSTDPTGLARARTVGRIS
jgi:hypothetical protein